MSKTTETDAFRRLKAFMKDVDWDHRQIIKGLQDQVEYLLEKCKIVEEIAVEKNGGKAVVYSDDQKKRLAVKGKRGKFFLLSVLSLKSGCIRSLYARALGHVPNAVAEASAQFVFGLSLFHPVSFLE